MGTKGPWACAYIWVVLVLEYWCAQSSWSIDFPLQFSIAEPDKQITVQQYAVLLQWPKVLEEQ